MFGFQVRFGETAEVCLFWCIRSLYSSDRTDHDLPRYSVYNNQSRSLSLYAIRSRQKAHYKEEGKRLIVIDVGP